MSVFRDKKANNFTVMSNHHLQNKELSLKAKGLMSLMLSLPENWDYTMKGLSRICKEGLDSIRAAIHELEKQGYVIRERIRSANGQLGAVEYTILEQPKNSGSDETKLKQGNPTFDKPTFENPVQENPIQLNTKELNTNLLNTKESNHIQSDIQNFAEPSHTETTTEADGIKARETYRKTICDNIDYCYLIQDRSIDREQLNEIIELMTDILCSSRKTIHIAGDEYPAEVVKSRFLKLDSSHIQYVMECLGKNTTYIHNIKKYLLSALFNAPNTINNYYSALVQHDMHNNAAS